MKKRYFRLFYDKFGQNCPNFLCYDFYMKIEHYKQPDELHVKLFGELDEHTGAYVRMSLDSLIDSDNIKRLYIDMSELSFMDSTGIGVLIGRYKRLKPRGIPIYLQSPTPTVDRVLGLSGIYEIMYKAV